MNSNELKKVLESHRKYLNHEDGGARANLIGADLSMADLSGAYLRWADLSGANMSGANLSGAYLRGADLSMADLSGANMSGANLSGANMSGANLSGANMSRANMSRAYLSGADLSGANMSGADLRNFTGNGKQIKTFQAGKYTINLAADIIQIGCKNHSIEDWFNFSDEDIESMDDGALEWWRMWKPILKQIIEASPAEK